MKINYDNKGMDIQLDKIPRLLYINENGEGCGQVYENGVRQKLLQEVEIKAKTNDAKVNLNSLIYKIKYIDSETHCSKIKQHGEESINDMTVSVSIKDIDVFKNIIDLIKKISSSEEIPLKIREDLMNRINDTLIG